MMIYQIFMKHAYIHGVSSCGVLANVLDCEIVVSDFELQLRYYVHFRTISKVKLATIVESDQKAPFSISTTSTCRGGRYFFLWIAPLTLDMYLILLSVKQGGIKYPFLSLWYVATWDWTQVFRTIGEHSTHLTNDLVSTFWKGMKHLISLSCGLNSTSDVL